MENQLSKIEEKIDRIESKLDKYSERITRIETTQNGFIKISTIIFTGIIGYILSVLNIRS